MATVVSAASATIAAAGVPKDPWAIDWASVSAPAAPPALPAWHVRFAADDPARRPLRVLREAIEQEPPTAQRPRAIEYSQAYETRRKIHLYASVATAPLFATQLILGQRLYNGPSSNSVLTAHRAMTVAIAGLFGVNTVTGAWNLWEGRRDPNRRVLRFVHGLLMIGSDAGFVATGLTAPHRHRNGLYTGNWSLHRSVALTSVGVASASYLLMLLGR